MDNLKGLKQVAQSRRRATPDFLDTLKWLLRFPRRKPLGAVGGAFVLVLILTALFANFIAPYNFSKISGRERLVGPSQSHIMGTDEFGRDVFSRVVHGARVSMYVATGAVLIMVVVATVIGITSAYFGGAADMVLQRFVDAVMVFPGLVLLLTIVALFGSGLLNVALAIGITAGIRDARVVRSSVLSVKENQYMDAARAIGCSHLRIMVVHVLPNVGAPIIILATLLWGGAILAESSLSFLGLGVPPPHPSWGAMIGGAGRTYMEQAPWLPFFPGLAISLSVFGFNMLGDALRDVWDPRLRGTQG